MAYRAVGALVAQSVYFYRQVFAYFYSLMNVHISRDWKLVFTKKWQIKTCKGDFDLVIIMIKLSFQTIIARCFF